ncbi:HAD family hydrolase [Paenibacillus sp. FSL H7-0331]|uniref:HAD family hydrolase n=1 Tax=Paenibacillus sp. FSL H7-0331 TaxID=1920421 RepID=UPI0009701F8A|nr:HAD family hydrolase [Paenibacillus sp. FSL H7-0331]OMF08584.1 hypothetical protein BK127_28350 [Paenibacillus sp. FSL H7-0331]
MSYKGILLDLDNTIYKYEPAHDIALTSTLTRLCDITGIRYEYVFGCFKQARDRVHIQLAETASSHNRILYFQTLLEILKVKELNLAKDLYEMYWNIFLDHMQLIEGFMEFLNIIKDKKVCIVTDLTAHIQYRKMEKLGIWSFCDYFVTSEEVGKEKPHPMMFMLAINKMDLHYSEVCMIGDSYHKDIEGASQLGIHSFWLNMKKENKNIQSSLITEFNDYEQIKEYFYE